ncbi:Uncharacterized protein FWK35_00023007 [Aphis craccivora]|uniref:Uncharacterized protein n=1 Tax=Aphis craccivora TaxID=307492 RepID=A0A6G0Y096_APHCR|nr:Uncharacterized protein FWK35_00023007 [Aphis craccivora]
MIVETAVLDSEQSDECIDFTMLCVFFLCVCVYTRTCRNNASILNFGGGFRYQNESSWCHWGATIKTTHKEPYNADINIW